MDPETHLEASVTVYESRIESSVFVPSQGDHSLPLKKYVAIFRLRMSILRFAEALDEIQINGT